MAVFTELLLLLTVVLGSFDYLLKCMLVAHESLVVLEQHVYLLVILLEESERSTVGLFHMDLKFVSH